MNMDEFTGRRIAIKGGVSGIGKVVAFHLLDTAAGRGQINVNFPKKVLAGDVTANFPLRLGLKNLSLALDLAKNGGAPMALVGTSREFLSLASSWGRSQVDYTAMLLLLEDIARCEDEI